MIHAGGVFGRNPRFNNVTIDGDLTVNGDALAFKKYEVDTLEVNSTAASTTPTTGAAVIAGGLGVGGAICLGGNVVMANGNGINFSATSDPTIAAIAARNAANRTGTNVSNNETVTIDGITYTFKSTLTPADYEVLIGADSTATFDNLRNAILGTGGSPGDYQVPAAHPTVTADAIAGTVMPLRAITAGTAGNSIAVSHTTTQITFARSAFYGGRAAQSVTSELLSDYEEGTWSPQYLAASGSFGQIATNVNNARYVKIGRTVHLFADINTQVIAGAASAGVVGVGNLPYAPAASQNPSLNIAQARSFGANTPCYGVLSGTSFGLRYRSAANGADANFSGASMGTGASNNELIFTATYLAA